MSFIDIISTVGAILALATAVDFLARDDLKIGVAAFLNTIGQREIPVGYSITERVNRSIGGKLFSVRAIAIYSLLSIISLILTYAFAYFTTERDTVAIFFDNPSGESLIVFAICLLGCVVGDSLSYAQTRFFLKNVDQERRGLVSVAFAISDAILSLSIFLLIFTITRLVAYMIVIGTTQVDIVRTQEVNAALAGFVVEELIEDGVAREKELEWSAFLASAKSPDQASVIDEISRGYDAEILGIDNSREDFEQKVDYRCSTDHTDNYFVSAATSEVIAREIALHRGIEVGGPSFKLLLDDINSHLENWTPDPDSECPFPLFTITQKIQPEQMIRVAGFTNVVWASFERTMYDFYTNVGFKLAPYAYFDPRADLPAYYRSLSLLTEYAVLGLRPGDYQASRLLAEFEYEPEPGIERLQVPFSPMLASALTVSGLFWLYLISIYLSKLAVKLRNLFGSLVLKFDITKGPAVSFGLAISVILIGIWVVSGVLTLTWAALLSF